MLLLVMLVAESALVWLACASSFAFVSWIVVRALAVYLAVALALPLFRCDAYRAAVSSVKASSVKASSCALKPGVEAPFSDTAPSEWNKGQR